MKKLFAIILLVNLVACQTKQDDSLTGKKALLAEKKSELKTLEDEIAQLKNEINKLDPPKEKPAVPVAAEQVGLSLFQRYIDVQGRVEADEVVNVSSEIGGLLLKVHVGEGQYVRKGQLVATTDVSTLETQIEEISAITKFSISNIKVKLHRTRKKLYHILEPLLKELTTFTL